MISRSLCLIFAFGALPILSTLAQAPQSANDQNLTADELVVNAQSLYAQGKYAEAAAMYQRFITGYGSAKEAQAAIRSMRPRLALSLLQLKKYREALEAINAALAVDPPLDPQQKQEMTFWRGVCQMQEKDCAAAQKSFEAFLGLFPASPLPALVQQFPAAGKIPEARLLIGTCQLLDEKFKEAAEYYASIKPSLNPANRGRATVLELYALVQANENDRALALVTAEYPRMGELSQIVTFQTLTLELGSRFLEAKQLRKSISCLQRVWSSDRLLKHQQARLADLESKLAAAEANPSVDPYTKIHLGESITKVRREIENFQKIPNFDSALRLRLATAYQAMGRYREAALIMEDMLATMPPDKIVESASANLVQCWGTIENWPRVIAAAKGFVKKFPQSERVPLVLYLQGIAEQKNMEYDAAAATFAGIVTKFPKSEFAPRAQFMRGFTWLLADKPRDAAIAAFQEFQKRFPTHEMAGAALYWEGSGWSFDKQYVRSREVMDAYLSKYKDGEFRAGAIFRKAYCAQQAKDYPTSIAELSSFLQKFPGADERAEAGILLGDACLAEGRAQEGIAAYQSIPPESISFYAEGVFKAGKVYKLLEEPASLRDTMMAFKASNPKNPRVAEAIYWIGWTYKQAGDDDRARGVYWDAIAEYGDDPEIRSVEDLFPAVARLYKGDEEQAQYRARLRDLGEESATAGKKTLATRALWAQAAALRKSDPARSQALFLEAAKDVNVQTTNPLLLADFAEALLASGQTDAAAQMFRDLVKWNPRAPQKDKALAALGDLELRRGNEKAALALYDRFDREVTGSLLAGRVLLAKADLLLARGQPTEAKAALEKLLANQFSSGLDKTKALYLLGEMNMKAGKPELAIPYYQRIYVMYGRWREYVAKAYLRSGQAFENLKDPLSARRTYQELTENEDLSTFTEFPAARDRLNALGGPLPKPEPTPAEG